MRFIIPSESRRFQLQYQPTGRGHDTGASVDPDACGSCPEYALAVSCAKPQVAYFPDFSCKAAGRVLPGFCFPCECGFRQVRLPVECGFPSSPASRANVASGRARLCRNLTDTSFLSVPLCAHLSGDRSITINPLSAVHFWYFPSISGRNREAFYQKYFYGISVLADILGIKPYFHKKNTRNRYQINRFW